jgi:uncharacterized membrane protein
MAAFCSSCGSPLPENAVSCPSCGRASATSVGAGAAAAPAMASTGGLTDNIAGLLAYVTIVPAIVFLVLEPYNKNRFIRFHAFQCLFIAVGCFAIGIAFMIIGMIPVINLLLIPVSIILWIGIFVVVILCMIKAYQGQMYKLPVIGDMAEKQANAHS